MTSKLNSAAERCQQTWNQVRSAVTRFREDERGGIEKVVAIAVVVLITTSALAAITVVVQNWVDDVPEPGDAGDFTVS